MEKKPLDGVKVVSLTNFFAGPRIAKSLADCGAEVIKLEGRSRPDPQRGTGILTADGTTSFNRSGDFNQYNTSVLSAALNLAKPRGIEIAKRLVAWADIVVENFSGGAMERMGLGYEELKKVKPDIVMLSACMMGQTGPYALGRGGGAQVTALSGFNQIAGWPDRDPVSVSVYSDFVAPRFALLAILAALDYRRRTGKGQYLDLSQYEVSVHFQAALVLDYIVNQRVAGRMGNHSSYAAPHGVYRCLGDDRWCAIAVFTDEEWESFCRVIGDPEWTRDTKFSTLLERKRYDDELDRLVEGWTVTRSAEEVMTLMQVAGVGAGIVQTTKDVMENDPQLKHRHLFWMLEHPEVGKYRAPGSPYILSKSACEIRRAPLLGEHNEYILKEILKLSDEEIAELVIEEVVE